MAALIDNGRGIRHTSLQESDRGFLCSQAYDSRTTQDLRYVVSEPWGTSVCSSPEGTGVNERAR